MISPVVEADFEIASVVPSWNVDAPEGSWIKTFLRVKVNKSWSKWYNLGIWSQSDDPSERHSVKGQEDANAEVDIDTLVLKDGVKAEAVQMKLQLNSRSDSQYPVINGAALVMNNRQERNLSISQGNSNLWNKTLSVPQFSQMVYPDGGNTWCSPTSVAMVLAYWQEFKGLPEPVVREAVKGVFDSDYEGTGNWPFNTAYAATKGMTAAVSRLPNLEEAERFIAVGIPLVMSISWKPGE
ncbi:peptidase C39 family protein, partial [bacterium]